LRYEKFKGGWRLEAGIFKTQRFIRESAARDMLRFRFITKTKELYKSTLFILKPKN